MGRWERGEAAGDTLVAAAPGILSDLLRQRWERKPEERRAGQEPKGGRTEAREAQFGSQVGAGSWGASPTVEEGTGGAYTPSTAAS